MMKQLISLAFAAIFLLSANHGIASDPVIAGRLEGLELCAEFQCGAAYFIGTFSGKVDKKTAKGGFIVSLTHDALPDRGGSAAINSGEWTLRAHRHVFSGHVVGGTIFNKGSDTFTVEAVLEITSGGSGTLNVKGELDHDDFPPTISVRLSQPPK